MSEIFHKGATVELDIEKMAFGGKGLSRVDGYVLFVEGAIPGSRVLAKVTKAKKRFAEAETVKVLEPGPYAVPALCPHFGKCGGCLFQDLEYSQQLRWKTEHVRDNLSRLAGAEGCAIADAKASPEVRFFRNKMEFAFSGSGSRLALGLHRRGSVSLVNVEKCVLQSELSMDIVRHTREFCRRVGVPAYDPRTRKGVWRFLVVRESRATTRAMVHLITSAAPDGGVARALCEELLEAFPVLTGAVHSQRRNNQAIALGERVVAAFGDGAIEEHLNGVKYRVGADAFFQTNTRAAEILYREALDLAGLDGSQTVLDLYCGAGGLGLAAAKDAAKVIGVESHEGAVKDAETNAKLNGMENCKFIAGDVMKVLEGLEVTPDVAFVDPPRAGMHQEAVRSLAELGPKRIVYVSCNPATLSRDVGLFMEMGYSAAKAQPVDLFPHGPHIECAVLLESLK